MGAAKGNKVWEGEKKENAIDIILSEVANGYSVRSIFKNQEIKDKLPSRKTFNEWLANDTELSDHYARVCAVRADDIFDEILEIADDQEDDVYEDKDGNGQVNHNVIKRSQIRIDARKWSLGKMQPKKYGDRVVNENINKNIEIPATKEDIDNEINDILSDVNKK